MRMITTKRITTIMIMMMIKTMAMMVTIFTMVMMVTVVTMLTMVTMVMVMTIVFVTVVTTWKKSLPKCSPPHKYTLLHHLRSLGGELFFFSFQV